MGHIDPIPFIERCAAGTSQLSCSNTPEERRQLIVAGLAAITNPEVSDLLTTGLILKISYSNKPISDLDSHLLAFEKFKQRRDEKTSDCLNRFINVISTLQNVTSLMGKPECMPNEGTWLTVLKKAVRENLRIKTNAYLEDVENIPLNRATYQQFSAALLKADERLAREVDEEKTMKPASVPSSDPDPPPRNPANETQDPVLTFRLKECKICVNHVTHLMGNSHRDCSNKTCTYLHVHPSAMGWKDEDYKNFRAIGDHLKLEVPVEHKIKRENLPVLHNGALPPNTLLNKPTAGQLSIAAPATTSEDTQVEKPEPEKSQLALPSLHAPLIGRNYTMRRDPL